MLLMNLLLKKRLLKILKHLLFALHLTGLRFGRLRMVKVL